MALEAMSRLVFTKRILLFSFWCAKYLCVCLWGCAFKMCNKCAINNYWVCVCDFYNTTAAHSVIVDWRLDSSALCVELKVLTNNTNSVWWPIHWSGHRRLLFVWTLTNCNSSEIFENFGRSMCVCFVFAELTSSMIVAAACVCFVWIWRAVCSSGSSRGRSSRIVQKCSSRGASDTVLSLLSRGVDPRKFWIVIVSVIGIGIEKKNHSTKSQIQKISKFELLVTQFGVRCPEEAESATICKSFLYTIKLDFCKGQL